MRCSCRECGTYMIQAESSFQGCVCPDCGNRCQDCLGTNTVITREMLASLKDNPRFWEQEREGTFVMRREEDDLFHGFDGTKQP